MNVNLIKVTSSRPLPTPLVLRIALVCLLIISASYPAAAAIDAASVQQSIDRGVAYLKSTQGNQGGWKEYLGQDGGLSSLCTLALLTSGVPPDDPVIQKALDYLRKLEPNQTYSVALQTLVFCQVGSPNDIVRIHRNVSLLEAAQVSAANSATNKGGWGYGRGGSSADPSNSQFALLALDAAEERGIKIKPEVFKLAAEYWATRQNANGSWQYNRDSPSTGSMTCAGIASMVICSRRLGDRAAKVDGDTIVCCGQQPSDQDPVAIALKWLGERFSVQFNPGNSGRTHQYYYLYAMERVGRMTGRRFIGGHDWYREGAEQIVSMQDGFQGFWSGVGATEDNRDVTTSFALLFLAKGKRRVAIGRLRYGDDAQQETGKWNTHPQASRQLILRLERNWGTELSWQSVTLSGATAGDLLQAPLIVISGSEALTFTETESAALKTYLDSGGTLLFDAAAGPGCGDATAFNASVRKLCNTWFESAPLQPLPPTHPVYIAEMDAKPMLIHPKYQLYGVEACCRTSVFLSPQSLTCLWELSDPAGTAERKGLPQPVRDSIETAARIGQNLLAYATGRQLRDKLDGQSVLASLTPPALQRGEVQIARLDFDAGGREARRALPNFVALAVDRTPIALRALPGEVAIQEESLRDVTFIWFSGRSRFQFTAAQRLALKNYLANGGMLIADAICGNEEFATAFRQELIQILPNQPLQPMPSDHAALTAQFGGFDLQQVETRTPSRGAGGLQIQRRKGAPRIEYVEIDGYAAVFFSPLDMSCALESQNSIQCPGYNTDDATKIGINLILYALQQ